MDRDDIRKVLAKDAKLYIFDMDGTILNSMVEWFHLGRNYLVAQGVAVPDDLEQRIETMTMDESAEYFQSLGVDKSIPEINEGIFAYIQRKISYIDPGKGRNVGFDPTTVPKGGQHSLHFDDIGAKMCRDGNGEIGRFELFSGYL